VLSMIISERLLEADLASRRLSCPDCEGRLAPWGYARSREVRMLHGVRSVRPRRAYCQGCGATHPLSPAWSVPRRRDGAEVIGEAMRQAALGAGHRTLATRVGRPPGTVRGWLRAGRRRTEALRRCGTVWAYALDPEQGRITPAGSPLGDAVEALATAARAYVLRFGPLWSPWELAVAFTGGLLYCRPRDPP